MSINKGFDKYCCSLYVRQRERGNECLSETNSLKYFVI